MNGDGIIIPITGDTTGFEKASKRVESAIKSLSRTANQLKDRIGGTVKSVLKLGPALLGIGGIYSILSKAVSSFMSANQQLSAQLSSAWTALGNVLGPIITQLVNWITQLIAYFINFLKLLGLTSKSASEASKKAGGAGAALQKSLLGFDELNKLTDNGGGGANGSLTDKELPDWLKTMADLLKMKEFEEAGRTLARHLNDIVSSIPWSDIGEKLSAGLRGALQFLHGALDEFDWDRLGTKIREFLLAIDWKGLFEDVMSIIADILNGAVRFAWGLITGEDISDVENFPLVKAIKHLKDSIVDLVEKISPHLEEFWNNVLLPFLEWSGEVLLPKIIESIADAIDWLGEHEGVLKLIEAAIAGVVGAFAAGNVIEQIGGFVAKIKEFGALEGVISNVTGLFGGPWVLAIGAAITAIVLLIQNWDTIKEKATELWATIQEKFDSIKEKIVGVWQSVVDWFNENFPGLGELFATYKEYFSAIWESLTESFRKVKETISEVWDKIKEVVGNRIEEVKGHISTFIDTIIATWEAWKNTFTAIFTGAWDIIKTTLNSVISVITGIIKTATSVIRGDWQGAWQNVQDTFKSLITGVVDIAQSIFTSLRNIFSNIIQSARAWGSDIISNIINGLASAYHNLVASLNNIAQTIKNFLGFSEPKEGPLSDFHTYMPDMIDLMCKGIKDNKSKAVDAVSDLAGAISKEAQEGDYELQFGISSAQASMDDFTNVIVKGFENLIATLLEIANSVAFSMPAIAGGVVAPYGVTGSSDGASTNSLTKIEEMLEQILNSGLGSSNGMSFKFYLDGKELTSTVTRIQNQDMRANGK